MERREIEQRIGVVKEEIIAACDAGEEAVKRAEAILKEHPEISFKDPDDPRNQFTAHTAEAAFNAGIGVYGKTLLERLQVDLMKVALNEALDKLIGKSKADEMRARLDVIGEKVHSGVLTQDEGVQASLAIAKEYDPNNAESVAKVAAAGLN